MRALLAVAGLAVGLVVGVGVGTLVDRSDTGLADSRAVAGTALAMSDDRPETALLLAVEALRRVRDRPPGDTYEARNALVAAWQRYGRVQAILRGHRGGVHALAFSPDGRFLASADETGVVRVWEVARRRELGRLAGHAGPVRAIAWSPDGTTLVSGGDDKTIRLWDVRRFAADDVLRGHTSAVRLLAFSPDGRRLASGQQYSEVRVWDVRLRRQVGATLNVSPVAFHFDAKRGQLVVANTIGEISRHAAHLPRPYVESYFDTGWTEYFAADFTESGKWLVLSGEDPLGVWRVTRSGKRPLDFDNYVVHPSALAAGAAQIALGYRGGVVTLTGPDPRSPWGRVEFRFNRATPRVLDIAPDDATVAVGFPDGTVRIAWLGQSPIVGKRVGAPRAVEEGTSFPSRDRKYVAHVVFADDIRRQSQVVVRDATGRRVGRQLRTRGRLAAFLPDGRRMALVGRGGQMRFWDVESGKPASPPFPVGFPQSNDELLAFDEGGTVLAAASEEGLQLWDVLRWAPLGKRFKFSSSFWARLDYAPARKSFVALTAETQGCCPDEYTDLTRQVIDPLLVSSDYEQWRERVCALVGRSLSRNEWRVHVPSRPFRRTCG